MDKGITIGQIQRYLKIKDYDPDRKYDYFLKLAEETGELAKALFLNLPHAEGEDIKNTIEEEFCDVLFYLCAIANLYGVDIEKWFPVKERETDKRFKTDFFNTYFYQCADGESPV
jgi:NTP pyrophosphatase (non-canonical NTP hydrolase)